MVDSTLQYSAFEDSTELLADSEKLRARFEQDGYLFLKGLLDPAKLLNLRRQIAAICAAENWLKSGTEPERLLTWTAPVVEGEDAYFRVYDQIQQLEDFHALAHDTAINDVISSLLGGPCFPHPLSVARLMFPFNTPWATPPHQDYPNNQGTEDLYACWIPLGDCAASEGPLAISPGSHKRGLLPLKYALGAGHRQVFDAQGKPFEWVSGPLEAGSVLIFHSLTVHRSMPNNGKSLRLSVDYRYQRDGDKLVEQSLHPHFQRHSWDELYAGWTSKALQYYWRKHDYEVVDWNADLHEVVDESMQQQVATKREYQRYRDSISRQFNNSDDTQDS